MGDNPKRVWWVDIPSTRDALNYVEKQYQAGQISKGTRDKAQDQIRRTTGVEFDSESAARRAAKSIRGATVSSGYSEQKGCPLWMLIAPIAFPIALGITLGRALGGRLK